MVMHRARSQPVPCEVTLFGFEVTWQGGCRSAASARALSTALTRRCARRSSASGPVPVPRRQGSVSSCAGGCVRARSVNAADSEALTWRGAVATRTVCSVVTPLSLRRDDNKTLRVGAAGPRCQRVLTCPCARACVLGVTGACLRVRASASACRPMFKLSGAQPQDPRR
eukprot:1467589-Rhodomonas_salina.2